MTKQAYCLVMKSSWLGIIIHNLFVLGPLYNPIQWLSLTSSSFMEAVEASTF